MSSFEMASSYIFPTYLTVLKWSKIDLSKIEMVVVSKVLIEISSFLSMLSPPSQYKIGVGFWLLAYTVVDYKIMEVPYGRLVGIKNSIP